MKFILFLNLLFLNLIYADVYVHGYTRSNGTYVSGHYRSNPNHTKLDNFSTYGNINPYTGKIGTKKYSDYNNYRRNSSNNNTYNSNYNNYNFKNTNKKNNSTNIKTLPNTKSNANYITINSNKNDVLSIQGTPNSMSKFSNIEIWYYSDSSSIKFINNKVNEWNNYGSLNVKIIPSTKSNANYITINSNKNDVLSIQGTPNSISKFSNIEIWYYSDSSSIKFINNKVNEWNNYGSLNVKM